MNIKHNISLAQYSTMRLGGNATHVCEVGSKSELQQAVLWAKDRNMPCRIIGLGSNIVWKDSGFDGLLIVNKILKFELLDDTKLIVGGGNNWDETVARSVEMGLSGLEFLSLIPGTVGATPIQNVGAYGAEISNILTLVRAYDSVTNTFVELANSDCGFGYRTSRFKTTDNGRYFIYEVVFGLSREQPKPPFYEALQKYLEEINTENPSIKQIRNAVIAIRQAKLPDPNVVANNGSFFANPIVNSELFNRLLSKFPQLKYWALPDGSYKLAAGWLVEQAGFSDYHDEETSMSTWKNQNLVLVNEHAKSTNDLLKFKQKIVDAVAQKFEIILEQEPELLP